MNKLIYDRYYWVRYNDEVVVAYFYNDGFGGAFTMCGSEEIYDPQDLEVLKDIEPYEG